MQPLQSEDLQDSPEVFDPKAKKRRTGSGCPGPTSQEECQRFAYDVLRRLDDDGRDMMHLTDIEVLVTSKWSGAGTGEIAFLYFVEAMEELYGWSLAHKFFGAWEIESHCQGLLSKLDHAHLHSDLLAPFDRLLIETLQGRQKYLTGLLEQEGNTPTLKKQYTSDFFEFALTTIDEWDPSKRWTDTSLCLFEPLVKK